MCIFSLCYAAPTFLPAAETVFARVGYLWVCYLDYCQYVDPFVRPNIDMLLCACICPYPVQTGSTGGSDALQITKFWDSTAKMALQVVTALAS